MKNILLWDPRFPQRAPSRLLLSDTLASACVRSGIATAANPAEAGALAVGVAISPADLVLVVAWNPITHEPQRVYLPSAVAAIGVAAGEVGLLPGQVSVAVEPALSKTVDRTTTTADSTIRTTDKG